MSTRNQAGPSCFRLAIQALVVLAHADCACPSAAIAQNLDSHAVFVRRVLAQLVRAKIVEAREGRDGGYRLARPADQITLAEVYCAFRPAERAELSAPGNAHIHAALNAVDDQIDQRVTEVFAQHTLATIIEHAALAGAQKLPACI